MKKTRIKTGLSQKEFSERYEIPLKTLQNWESNKESKSHRECPLYLKKAIEVNIEYEKYKKGEFMTELQDIERECYISKLNSYAAEVSLLCIKYDIDPRNNNVSQLLMLIQSQIKELRFTQKYADVIKISFSMPDIAKKIEYLKIRREYGV